MAVTLGRGPLLPVGTADRLHDQVRRRDAALRARLRPPRDDRSRTVSARCLPGRGRLALDDDDARVRSWRNVGLLRRRRGSAGRHTFAPRIAPAHAGGLPRGRGRPRRKDQLGRIGPGRRLERGLGALAPTVTAQRARAHGRTERLSQLCRTDVDPNRAAIPLLHGRARHRLRPAAQLAGRRRREGLRGRALPADLRRCARNLGAISCVRRWHGRQRVPRRRRALHAAAGPRDRRERRGSVGGVTARYKPGRTAATAPATPRGNADKSTSRCSRSVSMPFTVTKAVTASIRR